MFGSNESIAKGTYTLFTNLVYGRRHKMKLTACFGLKAARIQKRRIMYVEWKQRDDLLPAAHAYKTNKSGIKFINKKPSKQGYSTVTDFARFRGLSTSNPFAMPI